MKLFNALAALTSGGLILTLFSGCGGSSDEDSRFEAYDNTEEVNAYYAEHSDFFRFKTPADIPANLVWEDGMDLPEFASPKATKGGTLRSRLQDFPRTLRIVGPDSNGGFRPFILDDVVMQYARRHPNNTELRDGGFYFHPGIAESWALDRERKQVFVKINPEARWSDGEPITVEDSMFAFYFYQSPHHKSLWYNDWYGFDGFYTHITRYDEHTFSIGLRENRPNMLNLVVELNPLPRHFYREFGPDYVDRYQWRFVPTSGAYVVRPEDVRKGRSISLTRLDNWWAKDNKFWRNRYNYDRVRFDVVRDTAKAFEMFLKGDLDGVSLNLPEYWYEKLPDDHPLVEQGYIAKYKFFNDVPRPTYGLWMNQAKGLLQNKDIRTGIQYAANWDLVCQQYFRGDAIRMNTTADGYGTFTSPTVKARPFDPNLALEWFAKAGFTERGPDSILINEKGERLSIELSTGYEAFRDVMTILKQEALQAGIELRVEILDGTAGWKKVQEKKHEIMFTAFGVSPEMFPRYKETYYSANAFTNAWTETGEVNPDRQVKTQTNNLIMIADQELDEMILQYDSSDSLEEMIDLAYKMEDFLYEDASFVPGFVLPFYRNGYWRWRKFPDDFNVKISTDAGEYWLGWIDTEEKEATLAAQKANQSMDPLIRVFDQYATEEAAGIRN
jgi:microcin C transport system substrate-binding protein